MQRRPDVGIFRVVADDGNPVSGPAADDALAEAAGFCQLAAAPAVRADKQDEQRLRRAWKAAKLFAGLQADGKVVRITPECGIGVPWRVVF